MTAAAATKLDFVVRHWFFFLSLAHGVSTLVFHLGCLRFLRPAIFQCPLSSGCQFKPLLGIGSPCGIETR